MFLVVFVSMFSLFVDSQKKEKKEEREHECLRTRMRAHAIAAIPTPTHPEHVLAGDVGLFPVCERV